MNDNQLRKLLAEAHRDDAPPALATVLARAQKRPRRAWLALAVPAVALLAALLLWPRRPGPPPLARLDLAWSAPLDFLLDVPGADLLRETPRFDLKGTLP